MRERGIHKFACLKTVSELEGTREITRAEIIDKFIMQSPASQEFNRLSNSAVLFKA